MHQQYIYQTNLLFLRFPLHFNYFLPHLQDLLTLITHQIHYHSPIHYLLQLYLFIFHHPFHMIPHLHYSIHLHILLQNQNRSRLYPLAFSIFLILLVFSFEELLKHLQTLILLNIKSILDWLNQLCVIVNVLKKKVALSMKSKLTLLNLNLKLH
jgi:hypothetical protein